MNIKVKSMGLFSTVFVILLILKLCGLITISWLWVFAPLMFSVMVGVILLALMAMIAIVVAMAADNNRER